MGVSSNTSSLYALAYIRYPFVKGGGGEIRTHGTLRHSCFQDRCNRPLCHPSLLCYATAMRYLGIDYGTRRIGVAVSDEGGRVAFPLKVIAAGPAALSAVDSLIKEQEVGKVVIGESRTLGGEKNPVMEHIEQFARDLGELSGVPVALEQEFFTSALAARQFAPEMHTQPRRRADKHESGPRPKRRGKNPSHEALDAAAAALILQSYLDTLNSNGAH